MVVTKSERPLRVERVRRQFQHWREQRTHARSRIPEGLWMAAVAVARQDGLYRTARALRLDYGALKRHVEVADAAGAPPTFVELASGPSRECVIEVEGAPRDRAPSRARPAAAGSCHTGSAPRWCRGVIQMTPHMRILVAVDPVDFRRGIDGMARLCREVLDSDPFAGWLFVFRNRRATAIKILTYDSQGFWLAHKRLSRGRFRWWPTDATAAARLEAHQLQRLIMGGDPAARDAAPPWRRIRTA